MGHRFATTCVGLAQKLLEQEECRRNAVGKRAEDLAALYNAVGGSGNDVTVVSSRLSRTGVSHLSKTRLVSYLPAMPQTNILVFAQRVPTVEWREEVRSERKDQREEALTPWPKPRRKGGGRPIYQEKYEEALHKAIREDVLGEEELCRLKRTAPACEAPRKPADPNARCTVG